MAKRQRKEEDEGGETPTPRKSRRTVKDHDSPTSSAETPSGRKSILRGTPTKLNGTKEFEPSPSPLKKVLFATPSKAEQRNEDNDATPTASRNDRSARRKSARALRQQAPEDSDIEEDVTDARIAAEILDSEGDDDNEDTIGVADPSSAPDTPSKTGKQRGRPKGRRRERTPTPPPDLPPHELYFFQNRAGSSKTSANTLPSHLLLNHEDYRIHITAHKDSHNTDVQRLKQLHKRGFDQWLFELEEGFNLCMYGYGSKRSLLTDFATHLFYQTEKAPKIIVVNGHTPGLTIRDVLNTIASQVFPKSTSAKLPTQPPALVDLILESLGSSAQSCLYLLVHSLDHLNLRKHQALLARLASHPSISLIASVDTPNFVLLWDLSLTRQYRFLYHDSTTFEPYVAEIDPVEEVNALLGRSGRRLGGKDGVGYVLKSLPENARNLYRILVAEQLAVADTALDVAATLPVSTQDDMEEDDIIGVSDEEAALQSTPSRRRRKPTKAKAKPPPRPAVPTAPEGVEYRTLYHKAVEEFVCSSELNFRTLLKEFHDHQMIESRKDALGTERLVVPFRREELEGILEELV